ncbi:MAG: hypothetical protein JW822_14270 [Spirochaetales bacterium]|nr:hypothetical protein [Spirochaetales bacterium]
MEQRIYWLKYGEKKILYCDYSNIDTQEILKLFTKSNNVVLNSKEKILMLTDFSDVKIDKVIIQRLKDAEARAVAKKVGKTAVLGISGIKRQILNFYNATTGSNAKAFSNRKDALRWLAESKSRPKPEFSSMIEDKDGGD